MTDFIIADFTNPPKKRKITNAARACDTCRRNKKRCIHTDGQALRNSRPASDSPAGKQKSAPPERPPTSRSQHDGGPETYTAAPQIQTPSDSGAAPRFIGHLNPEVAFLARSGPDGQQPAVRSSRTIGVWQSPNQSGQATSHPQMSPMSLLRYSSGLAQSVITPVVHDQFFGALPPAKDLQYLETFYFDNIHVIMPLIDKAAYAELDPSGPDHVLLSLGICLLASMSPSMKEHLHVGGENTSISHAEFGRRVFAAMRIAVDLAMVTDRITLIRSLTIMSMFNNGEADLEMSSQMMFRAVSIGYTVGLHQWMRTPEEEESLSDLFCCLWSMDKLLAAIQGRPVIMHEVDMAKFPSECVEKRPPAFRAFIRISLLLDAIIALYRPRHSARLIPDSEFPSFQELIRECNAHKLSSVVLNTLELFYHATAILSCRTYHSESDPSPEPDRNTRPQTSSMAILRIMGEVKHNELINLPFVPYAVSLSLSTAYLHLHRSNIDTHRARAYDDALKAYDALSQLGEISSTAALLSDLAKKALQSHRQHGPSRRPSLATNSLLQQSVEATTGAQAESSLPAIPQAHPLGGPVGTEILEPAWTGFDSAEFEAFMRDYLDPAVPTMSRGIDDDGVHFTGLYGVHGS